MTDAKLTYIGPLSLGSASKGPAGRSIMKRLPVGFLLVVALPTLVAAIYFLLIATPRYVSEARFIVRAPTQPQVSSIGVALQGVGLAPTQTDAYAVHEYVTSYGGIEDLNRKFDLRRIFGRPGIDPLSRYPRPGESDSFDGLQKAFKRFVTVGYNSQTGISTLRVEAFKAQEAQVIAKAMLDGGEALVNQLNERSARDTVASALERREAARQSLTQAQVTLGAFRNREQFIDPTRQAAEGGQLIGGLLATLAELNAERSQLAAEAPQSPQLPALNGRIRAFERQIATERAKIVGNAASLAPRIGSYESLLLQQELANREYAAATSAVTSAELESRRQKLYLERIAAPSLPDVATEPKRWRSILTVLVTCLLVYGIGWLIWAGVREHRQD